MGATKYLALCLLLPPAPSTLLSRPLIRYYHRSSHSNHTCINSRLPIPIPASPRHHRLRLHLRHTPTVTPLTTLQPKPPRQMQHNQRPPHKPNKSPEQSTASSQTWHATQTSA
ncbi:hypothetical protein B0T14DRAFT_521746 [Immersiella caudata]|uniref:Secreted protein n=1 Tax=Immersiella caudata TaxID=314043 RepID=A0AA39WSB7_9PEZI|nr:hypothetical protein B0T14DRAFT_521746 [Immersiella caudata]